MNAITKNELILNEPMPIDRNAAAVYVASLPANTGKRTQAQALRVVAGIFNNYSRVDLARRRGLGANK